MKSEEKMKKNLIFIIFLITVQIYANDAYVKIGGGQVKISEENPNIKLKNEELKFELYEDYYSVTIIYTFYNYGAQSLITTAFPEYKTNEGLYQNYKLRNFNISYGNGNEIPYSYHEAKDELSDHFIITGWYVKEIDFASQSDTQIIINYNADYSVYGTDRSVQYLLGTGNTWYGTIENLEINIVNHSSKWIDEVLVRNDRDYLYRRISDDQYQVILNDFDPDIKDEVKILFQDIPLYWNGPFNITERRFIFKDNKLDKDWFNFLSSSQLRILRNSIYAYRGYLFRSIDLQNHFNEESWYNPDSEFSEDIFTENEKYNIEIISNIEKGL